MGHFYIHEVDTGLDQPFYETPYADPKKGMRPVDIRDARKVGAFPSPNTIMGILAKPGIQWWSDDLLMDAALSCAVSLNGHETPNEMKPKIRELHKEWKEQAANAGTAIHDDIEHAILKRLGQIDAYTPNPEVDQRIVNAALDWLDHSGIAVAEVEAVFTDPVYGLGGKIDVVGWDGAAVPTIVDWKSTSTNGKPIRTYPKDKTPLLAAYAMGYFGDLDVDCWNIFLSRDEPGLIYPVKYTPEEIEWGWQKFSLCYELWVLENDYDPRTMEGSF